MAEFSTDVAIIGAGTAGLAARAAAEAAGARTLLIEAGPDGTTCARVGCMPSKLLIAAAEARHATGRFALFGHRLEGRVRTDGPAVMDRVRRERDRFVSGVLASLAALPDGARLRGRARFAGPTELRTEGGDRVRARAVVIATGSRPSVPPALRELGPEVLLTNETVFELPDLPASLAVVGAGPLGIELAQAFARLGTRVTVLDKGLAVGGASDPAVGDVVRDLVGAELALRLGVEVEARPEAGGARLSWTGPGGERGSDVFERVLAAAGRLPDLAGLALEHAEIALDEAGAPLFDRATAQCGTSPVFVAGDADGDRPVLHEAALDGRIAGRNAARFPDVERAGRTVPFAITFSDPQIAVVGGGWKALAARDPAVGAVDFADSGRARIAGRNAGLARLYADTERGLLLGGEIAGPGAEHLGHLLAWAVQRGLTADEALDLPFYHPTLEESLRSALRSLCRALPSRPARRAEDAASKPGD